MCGGASGLSEWLGHPRAVVFLDLPSSWANGTGAADLGAHRVCPVRLAAWGGIPRARMGRTTNIATVDKCSDLGLLGLLSGMCRPPWWLGPCPVRAARDAIVNPEASPSVARIGCVPPSGVLAFPLLVFGVTGVGVCLSRAACSDDVWLRGYPVVPSPVVRRVTWPTSADSTVLPLRGDEPG